MSAGSAGMGAPKEVLTSVLLLTHHLGGKLVLQHPRPGGSGNSSPAGTETQSAAVAAGPLLIHTRGKHGASVTRGSL